MPARKPNFFIIGAPKCGTTSLATWLDSHPEVCVSRPKEPHFFYPYSKRTLRTLGDYEACFAHAHPHHNAIGEASTNTIYSIQAIQSILKYQPQAKFILCLRNPVDMVISLHNHYVFSGLQRIENFVEAWNSKREILPTHHHRAYSSGEFYRYAGALGTHYRNVKQTLPEDRLLSLILDDMITYDTQELRKVTEFLEISPSSIPYPKKNVVKRTRSTRVRQLHRWLILSKQKLGIQRSLGVGGYLDRANTAYGTGAATMTSEIRTILAKHFAPEIRMLESLLDRDLCDWSRPSLDTSTKPSGQPEST